MSLIYERVRSDGRIENVVVNARRDSPRRFQEFEAVSKGIKDINAAVSFERLIIDDFIPSVFAAFDKSSKVSHNEGRVRLLGSNKLDVNSEVNLHVVRLKPCAPSNCQVRRFR